MLKKLISIVWENILIYLFFTAFATAATAAQEYGLFGRGVSIGANVATAFIILYVQRAVLFGAKFSDRQADGRPYKPPFLSFTMKAIVLLFLPSLILAGIVIFLAPDAIRTFFFRDGQPNLLYAAFGLLLQGIVISISGTWLPATVYGEKPGLLDALERGPSTFFFIFPWTLLWGFIEILKILVVIATTSYGITWTVFWNREFSAEGLLLTFLTEAIDVLNYTMVAVAVARSYLRFEKLPEGERAQA